MHGTQAEAPRSPIGRSLIGDVMTPMPAPVDTGASILAAARLMLGHTAVLTALGVVLGLAGALAMTRLITAQLYEVAPRDPLTLLITAGTLVVVALTAAWLPMRRATRVDPIVTLRAD